MAVTRWFSYGIAALMIAGCGQTVKQTLHVPADAGASCATEKRIVLLPLADYSSYDNAPSAYRRNMAFMEAISDQLAAKGMQMPVQEDVFLYLVDQGIINVKSYESKGKESTATAALRTELRGDWSGAMKNELRRIMAAEERIAAEGSGDGPLDAPGTHGLTPQAVSGIGKAFGVDYVLRGRLIEYQMGSEHTWDPLKRGILPFVYDSSSQFLFGFADSETYDTLNAMAVGGLAGALIGNNQKTPFGSSSSDYAANNSLTWGLVGAGAGYLAEQSGRTPEAQVELRLWVQDAETGQVVWSNRTEVKVAPLTVFDNKQEQALFKTAVNKAASALVDDFWNKMKVYL